MPEKAARVIAEQQQTLASNGKSKLRCGFSFEFHYLAVSDVSA